MTRTLPRLIAAPLLLAALALALSRPAPAAADTPVVAENYGAIVRTALTAVEQYRGECFPWVKTVVKEAIGRTIGFDYNLGYLEAGAVEVPLASARDGDVLQIANPAITRPDADYPGLHTAIVMDNYGDGSFRVIDSNMNYDGVVHIRDDYKPADLVARYPGLAVRAYRFTDEAGNVNAAIAAPPVPAVAIGPTFAATGTLPEPGAAVTIAADGDCLRLRDVPGLSGSVLGCLPTGASAAVAQAGPTADGYRWVQVSAGSLTGWVAAEYLAEGVTSLASAPAAAPAFSPPPVAAPASPPPVAEPPRGAFASPPRFGATTGQASAVFLGGTADQLVDAATEASASGVWVQDSSGAFQLLIVGGPDFMMDAFRATFAVPFEGPTAVTLIGTAAS